MKVYQGARPTTRKDVNQQGKSIQMNPSFGSTYKQYRLIGYHIFWIQLQFVCKGSKIRRIQRHIIRLKYQPELRIQHQSPHGKI